MRVDVDKSNLVHTKTSISLFTLVVGSFLFDKFNLLDYKMSPIDNGPENFLQLYKNRIFL